MTTSKNIADKNTELIMTLPLKIAKANNISEKYAELILDYWETYLYSYEDATKQYYKMMREAKKYNHSYKDKLVS